MIGDRGQRREKYRRDFIALPFDYERAVAGIVFVMGPSFNGLIFVHGLQDGSRLQQGSGAPGQVYI
jgi:hypothetical protein